MFAPVVGDWSVWWFFRDDGGFDGWYGNLESPRVRWSGGVDTSDRALDVVVEPDRSVAWKDEDEFALLTGRADRWTASQAVGIRADGEHLMRLAEAGAFPFDGRWTDFRPDPAWTVPDLPPDWDRPHLAGV
jgi:predicted RNA-binding protein associated with RNAse of E/G family